MGTRGHGEYTTAEGGRDLCHGWRAALAQATGYRSVTVLPLRALRRAQGGMHARNGAGRRCG